MPQKNTLKDYVPNAYYHVYARGANKQTIFLEVTDFEYFKSLCNRYLNPAFVPPPGTVYPQYHAKIKLICYCLMKNHFHLLVHQGSNPQVIQQFMRSLMTSYAKYFNWKYKRTGSLFESRYKAKHINDDSYLVHISRYIHMNPRRWQTYRQSSLHTIYSNTPPWLSPKAITAQFSSFRTYQQFLDEYQNQKDLLEQVKQDLANF